jgi:hypothetical protein
MARISKVLFGVILFFLAVNFSCTTTQFKSVWKKKTYDGRLNSVLVIGIAERHDLRTFFEKEFAKQLNNLNTKAIASVEILPSEEELKEDTILAAARKHGIETILVTHLVSLGGTTAYHSPDNAAKFYGYYHWAFAYVHGPLYYASGSQTVVLATNIYEVKTEELIWSVRTKTLDVHESKYRIITSKSSSVIKRLRKEKLI